jgi:hypothetical protein
MSARLITAGVLAVLVTGVLAACSPDAVPTSPEPDAAARAPARILDSELGSPDEPAPLDPGRYLIPFIGASDDAPWAEIAVPDGWGHDRLHPATGPDLDPHLRRIELFTVTSVAADPCRSSADPVGPEVADLMTALAAQRTVRPEPPRPVAIDGYDGSLIQVRVPVEVDVRECQLGGALVPFMIPGGSHATVFPGWSYRVWAIDVDGERLVIMAAHGPQVTAAERAELTRMVQTLTLVDAPTS